MSQLPFPSYNPSASPVQTSVVPFQPSVPQQVEIGGGTAELGAAFSQFSQTLASFAANQISTNRAKAMAEGQLKAEKSRKTFRQLVESGEIKPEENPWEALGAASADGVMSAEKFKNGLRLKYDAKVANDPNFRLSVSSVEEFVNNEVQNAMTSGMQNPVWQRSFMKEVTPYISSLSENHASGVAVFRRQRMTEAMTVGVVADIDLFNTDSKGMDLDDPRLPALTKRTQDAIQARFDEAYQTFGKDAVSKIADTLVDLEIASGSDPKVMEIIRKIKGGTGFVADTEQVRAARLEKSDQIEAARASAVVRLGTEFYMKSLSEKGEAPGLKALDEVGPTVGEDDFHSHMKKVRPDLDDDDIYALYAEVSKKTEAYRGEIIKSSRLQTLSSYTEKMREAIMNPSSKDASLWKDPEYLKSQVRRSEIELRKRMRLPLDTVEVDKSVDSVMAQLKFDASMRLSEGLTGRSMPERAQLEVAGAASLGTKPASISTINDAVIAFQRNPSRENTNPTLQLGLYMYQEAKRQNVPLESLGMAHMEPFFSSMESQLMAGSTIEASAYFASQNSPATTAQRRNLNDPKIREGLINAADGAWTWRSTATSQVDALITRYLDWAAATPASQMWTPEDHGTQFVRFAEARAVQTSSGWTVLPVNAPQSLRGADALDLIESEITKVFKETNSEVTGIRLVLGRNDQFQVFATSDTYPGGEYPTPQMAEALKKKYGIGDNFSARELDEAYRSGMRLEESRIQAEVRRQAEEMNRKKPVWNGVGYGYQHGYAGYIPASESQMTPGMREAVKRTQNR